MAEQKPLYTLTPTKANFDCKMDEDSVSVENNGKIYTVTMDCRNFIPEELTIQITSTLIKIEGKHETEDEAMEFYEEYIIPDGVISSTIQCLMNENGALRITAPVQPSSQSMVSQSSAKVSNESSKVVQRQKELESMQEQEELEHEIVETEDTDFDDKTLASHEDVSEKLVKSDDKVQLQLKLSSEFTSKEIQIRSSIKQKIVTIAACKKTKTAISAVQDICKRFELPDDVEPKSIVGNFDKKIGVLTITGKRTKTVTQTQTVQKTSTVEQQNQVQETQKQQQQQITTTAKNVTVINKVPAELVNDSDQITGATEIFEVNQQKYVKITAKIPTSYKPEEVKVTIYKNAVTITIRQETTIIVRTIYKKITIKNVVLHPQEGQAKLDPDTGILEILAPIESLTTTEKETKSQEKTNTGTSIEQRTQQQTSTSTTSTVKTEQHSHTQQQTQIVEETKIQPKISNESITQEITTNAEDITKQIVSNIADGKTFNVEINVSSYKAEEIEVKIMQRTVTIRGRQQKENSSQEFYKMFTIPEGIHPRDLQCTLSQNGILRITSTKLTIRKSGTTEGTVQISPSIQQSKDSSSSSTSVKQTSTTSADSGMIMETAENFERKIEAFGYKPDEIEVKFKDGWIIIQGKQKMSEENNWKSREFMKKFTIPTGLNPNEIITKLSPDGILTVTKKQ